MNLLRNRFFIILQDLGQDVAQHQINDHSNMYRLSFFDMKLLYLSCHWGKCKKDYGHIDNDE